MYLNDAMLDSGALARRLLAPANNLVPVNLLSRQQASLEDAGTAGWAVNTLCTIARSTAQAAVGSASLEVTSTGAGTVTATTLSASSPVIAGRLYTGMISFRAASTTATVQTSFRFIDSAGATVSTASSAAATDTASGWTTLLVTAVAPATAVTAYMRPVITATGASEVHYVDKVGLWEGAGGSWVNGGERLDPSTLGWYWDESVGRRLFVWDTINSRWQMVYGDTGWRDVSGSYINGWSQAAGLFIRRIGQTVHVAFEGTAAGTATSDSLYTLPTGFQATTGINARSVVGDTATPPNFRRARAVSTAIDIGRASNTGPFYGSLSYPTTDAWPTTLPGTASGTIPNL